METALVTVKVKFPALEGQNYFEVDSMLDAAALKEHIAYVEDQVVQRPAYCGPVELHFIIFFPDSDEVDDFTRYYVERRHIETV